MRVFTCIDHASHWPVGCASVIVALNKRRAITLLKKALITDGLDPNEPFTLQELDLTKTQAIILDNGEY